MIKTFPGGTHIHSHKQLTMDVPIESPALPQRVIIPLSQHTGSPARAVVKPGDLVKTGTRIAEATGAVSVPIHASISGSVSAIVDHAHPVLGHGQAIVIDSDGQDTLDPAIKLTDTLQSLDTGVLLAAIQDAGIVGLGGAAFPSRVKLTPPRPVDVLVINAVECEPYLTCDYRLMMERPDDILKGIILLRKILNVPAAIIGVENDKPLAVKLLRERSLQINAAVKVVALQPKYPQGAEKQLIKSVLGREVPPGKLPFEAGVVVQNVATALAVYEAVSRHQPLYERVLTVTGGIVRRPANLRVRIGTLFSELIAHCGGTTEPAHKIIMGGPMMGLAQYTAEVPVIKGTSGILLLSKRESRSFVEQSCIRCSRCVDVCPVNLLPYAMSLCQQSGNWERAREYTPEDCIECGSCTYVCPAKRRLAESVRLFKTVFR